MVFITKTHFPLNIYGTEEQFTANKMVVIVRNPLDVFPSLANLMSTKTQSLTVNEQYHTDFPEWWEEFLKASSENLAKNHAFVFSQIAEKIPTYIVRYGDLKLNPEPVLRELMCFLLDVPTIEGTLVEKRIIKVASQDFTT